MVIRSTIDDKKEQYNAMVTGGRTLQELKGNVIEVTGYIMYTKQDDEDPEKEITCTTFRLKEGGFAGGVSPVVSKAVLSYVDIFGEITKENPASFKIVGDKSKNGNREFLNLELV